MSHLSVITALIVAATLTGCQTREVGGTNPLTGAEPNKSDPQWVIQQTPKAKVALVFVHGIFGDTVGTWTGAAGESFFRFLDEDPSLTTKLDMFAFGYTSTMLGAGSFTIQEAANRLHERLKYAGVLDYPAIVFVAHSMGGLVTLRELLTHRELIPQVPLVVFYATPQEGAQITEIARHVSANPALEEMLPSDRNGYLQALNDEWKEITKGGGPPIICGYEKQATYSSVVVVPWASATRFCSGPAIPISADHISIVKPDRPGHDSIVLLVNALKDYVVGADTAARLELPDFAAEADREWSYTLHAALGKQAARIVNAGRLPLRYVIGNFSDPRLLVWPDDTPRTLRGQSTEELHLALMFGANANEYRFTLSSDAAADQHIVVRVPDLAPVRAQQAALMNHMFDDLNIWLASDDIRSRLSTQANQAAVTQLFVERARQAVDREIPNAPDSVRWIITSDMLQAANWPALAIEALREAEQTSPRVAFVPSVQYLAASSSAASGDSRVFRNTSLRWGQGWSFAPQSGYLGKELDSDAAYTLATRLRTVPALRSPGLTLEGDLRSLFGDSVAARDAYEEAAKIRLTPLLADRIGVPRSFAIDIGEAFDYAPATSMPTATMTAEPPLLTRFSESATYFVMGVIAMTLAWAGRDLLWHITKRIIAAMKG